ncbi:MAG TPA: hypothetical protein VIJ26_14435, partial [Thermoanaerobaculia bacterium]
PREEEKPLDKVATVNPDDLEKEALSAAAEARSLAALSEVRTRFLGRRSALKLALRDVRDRETGMTLNAVRETVESALATREAELARAELKVPPEKILDRLRAAFLTVPPLSGTGSPRLWLEHWEAEGETRGFEDPRRAAELARTLTRIWSSFVPTERPPGEEAREWYTAESP